jgi:acyl-CoA synthetase (AMP-forming)/AMP-acid ligase II
MLDDLLRRRAYNAVADFVDAPVACGLSEKVAFIDAERSLSYGELQTRTCRFAAALKNLGLRPEERLAVLLYDTIDFPVAFWGGMRAGIVVLPLNTLLTAEHYAYILSDSRASAIVVAAPLAKALRPILDRLPRLRTIILVDASAEERAAFAEGDVHDFADLVARDRPLYSSRRRFPTRSHSGCIHPAPPATPRGSSTSTPRLWRRRG